MMKILIVGGSLQNANRGVNALTRGTINAIIDTYGENTDIKILSYSGGGSKDIDINIGDTSFTIHEIPFSIKRGIIILIKSFICRLMRIKKSILPESWLNNGGNLIFFTDIVMDISGGDSFTDIYGLRRFIAISIPKLIAINIGKPLILLPQTIGPFNSPFCRNTANYIVKKSRYCFVRDKISQSVVVDNFHIEESKARYVPDMAFYMKSATTVGLGDIVAGVDKDYGNIIGVNVSALLYNGGYKKNNQFGFIADYKALVLRIITYFLKNDCRIVLIPHVIGSDFSVENDFILCNQLYLELKNTYKNRIFTLQKQYREDELKSIIGGCSFFIGSRMHACIGAISMGVPTVPIAYSRKFIGIWQEYGMSECVADPRYMSQEQILEKVKFCFKSRDEIKDTIQRNLSNTRIEIQKMFELIKA